MLQNLKSKIYYLTFIVHYTEHYTRTHCTNKRWIIAFHCFRCFHKSYTYAYIYRLNSRYIHAMNIYIYIEVYLTTKIELSSRDRIYNVCVNWWYMNVYSSQVNTLQCINIFNFWWMTRDAVVHCSYVRTSTVAYNHKYYFICTNDVLNLLRTTITNVAHL